MCCVVPRYVLGGIFQPPVVDLPVQENPLQYSHLHTENEPCTPGLGKHICIMQLYIVLT